MVAESPFRHRNRSIVADRRAGPRSELGGGTARCGTALPAAGRDGAAPARAAGPGVAAGPGRDGAGGLL